ncbi:MAG: nucleotidyltransferase family protein [Clostridiales bacterium]|nr:nucleotidyltransferase family protein [Clostridiales bacterium]
MITGIIMASGFSRRMNRDKLLVKIDDKEMIRYSIEAAKKSYLEEIILVYRDNAVKNIARSYDIKTVHNPNAHLGQSQSIIRGIKASRNSSYMFLAGDQPFISHSYINKLICEYRRNNNMIVASFQGNHINTPVIFPSSFKADLLNLEGDRGGRDIIKGNPKLVRKINVESDTILLDIDTMEEYKSWIKNHSTI